MTRDEVRKRLMGIILRKRFNIVRLIGKGAWGSKSTKDEGRKTDDESKRDEGRKQVF